MAAELGLSSDQEVIRLWRIVLPDEEFADTKG